MLFVDKVAGAPVSPTVDNYHENMVSQVQSVLPGNSPPLHLSSRLDTCTSGTSYLGYLFEHLFLSLVAHLLRYAYVIISFPLSAAHPLTTLYMICIFI
jgi:hypothetical protein